MVNEYFAKKQRFAYIINIIFFALIMAGDICYMVFGKVWIKGLTSALFVVLAEFNLLLTIKLKIERIGFSAFLLLALFFAMLGDIVLEVHFITGAVMFAVGHLFFFVAFCKIKRFKWKDLIYGCLLAVPSILFITLAPIFEFSSLTMELVCVVYAIIISFMVGKAIANYVNQNSALNFIVLLGSVLFFISDLMLLLNVFASFPSGIDIICLATYYPAEFLLAHSILHTQNNFFKKIKLTK